MNSTNSPISTILPQEVFLQIFTYLDLPSLTSCFSTCQKFHKLTNTLLWKMISLRDFSHFLSQTPLTPSEQSRIHLRVRMESPEDAQKDINDPFTEPLTDQEQELLYNNKLQVQDWKEFYKSYHELNKRNISGIWIGDYGAHGFELIKIYHKGYKVYAKKLTGDPNVPAKRLTWQMHMDETLLRGKGEVHLAETGYVNSKWNTAYLDCTIPNILKIKWIVSANDLFGYAVTFMAVKAGKAEFDPETMGRRIEGILMSEDLLAHELG